MSARRNRSAVLDRDAVAPIHERLAGVPEQEATAQVRAQAEEPVVRLSEVNAIVEDAVARALAQYQSAQMVAANAPEPAPAPPPSGPRARYRMIDALAMKSNIRVELPGLSQYATYEGKPPEEANYLHRLGHDDTIRYAHFIRGEFITDDPEEMAELDRLIRAGKVRARRAPDARMLECPEHDFQTYDAEEWRQHLFAFHPHLQSASEIFQGQEPYEHTGMSIEAMRAGLGGGE